jgi:DNA-binding FrmR family transcriptional regulator
MEDNIRADALKRLNYIEGHLNGIKRMVAEDQYCVDILKQTYAVRKAIERLEARLLEGHLRNCVPSAIAQGSTDRVVSELMALYELKPASSLLQDIDYQDTGGHQALQR